MKDSEIVQRILQNDHSAFGLVYQRWFAPLCVYANRFLGSNEEAEETVQEVMVKVWEQRQKLARVQQLNSYLYRMVYNACMNHLDHRKVVHKHRSEAIHELNSIEWNAYDNDTPQQHTNLIKALETLPPKNKEVFELHYFKGLKHKEIAQQLNISDRTVETHIVKGLRKLREILKKNMQIILFFSTGF